MMMVRAASKSGRTRAADAGFGISGSDMCLSLGAPPRTAGSAGQSVELADLAVEGARGHDPAQDADASGHRAGGVPELGLGVGGGRDDHLRDNVRGVGVT